MMSIARSMVVGEVHVRVAVNFLWEAICEQLSIMKSETSGKSRSYFGLWGPTTSCLVWWRWIKIPPSFNTHALSWLYVIL